MRDSGEADWSVLIMDAITTKVMSSSCRISDVLDYGVSRETPALRSTKQPLPSPSPEIDNGGKRLKLVTSDTLGQGILHSSMPRWQPELGPVTGPLSGDFLLAS